MLVLWCHIFPVKPMMDGASAPCHLVERTSVSYLQTKNCATKGETEDERQVSVFRFRASSRGLFETLQGTSPGRLSHRRTATSRKLTSMYVASTTAPL